jgi:hypothetical protein
VSKILDFLIPIYSFNGLDLFLIKEAISNEFICKMGLGWANCGLGLGSFHFSTDLKIKKNLISMRIFLKGN